jgi:hypothetical protein
VALTISLLSATTPGTTQDQTLAVVRVAPCQAAQLTVSIPPPGPKTAGVVMQGAVFALWVTNRATTCWVRGYPRFTALVSAGGKNLPFTQLSAVKTVAGGPYADAPVILERGLSAASLVAYAGGSLPAMCAKWLVLRPLMGAPRMRLTLLRHLRICPGSYRTHELQVTPYHPSSVGPFSHWP